VIKFKITPDRVAVACGYIEWMNLTMKDRNTVLRVAPRFAVNKDGEYEMQIEYDEDGDLKQFTGYEDTLLAMAQVTPKRLEKLIDEFSEAARNVVNPQKGEG
jgi:hypothetical protein